MRPCCTVVLFLSLALGTAFAQGDAGSSAAAPGTIGITYDEGLSGKIIIIDKVAGWLSLGYNVVGADTIGSQPLQDLLMKIGGSYEFLTFSKLHLSGYGEFAEVLNQKQTEGTVIVDNVGNRAHERYNVWDTRLRVGVLPEWFLTDNLSLSYKVGLQLIFHGTEYKVNAAADGTQSTKSDHTEFGVFASGLGVPGQMYPYYNISLTWYIAKLF